MPMITVINIPVERSELGLFGLSCTTSFTTGLVTLGILAAGSDSGTKGREKFKLGLFGLNTLDTPLEAGEDDSPPGKAGRDLPVVSPIPDAPEVEVGFAEEEESAGEEEPN